MHHHHHHSSGLVPRGSGMKETAAAKFERQHMDSPDLGTDDDDKAMADIGSLQNIFRATSDEVRHLLSCDRVLVYRFNPDWSGEFIHESVAQMWEPLKDLQNNFPLWQDTYLQENEGGRYRNHESLAVGDVETAGFTDCHLDNLRRFEIRAFLTVPVFVGEQLWGLLGAYQNGAPRHWQAREIHLLHQIANQLGVAVYQAQLLARFQELEHHHHHH
uniref:Histidine kinase n=1 Tax=Synechocystis sp. (strain ATCC 27184 / PCC 6803 / Kazusa) TaxID=1111708 RepID=UPI00084A2E01|nr:Chain A, Histidine kinase [Synechocystis sp. PCC 6803 substr. Kazusa]5DFY_A Chain A, Histidine kinase [Synechocystis sp. PCC 6803 substr. Kazusa]5M82_A Chain A, Sensory transduction histidine kinase [Synechocystis sp. PCC 6803 substr. Kazusa]5M85_A Chain A, Sensory transduction histidine kinase [Synechocystis sp. PCC 6803 substr. Kazusa]